MNNNWWEDKANETIIGLSAEPWGATAADDDAFTFPTEGYDGTLGGYARTLKGSGRSREDWLALADHMIERWTKWRAHILTLPD